MHCDVSALRQRLSVDYRAALMSLVPLGLGNFTHRLDRACAWAAECRRKVVTQAGSRAPQQAAALTALAEALMECLCRQMTTLVAYSHGRVLRGRFAVVAFGKLGSGELTASSDLDLVFVYDVPDLMDASDGPRGLAPTIYFSRLGQHLVGALTHGLPSGPLYDVDMRLRPFGDSGPLATSSDAFHRYYQGDAWTWEHMALTRARTIAGDPDLCDSVTASIATSLTRRRDPDKLVADVANMRHRMAKQHAGELPWDIKHRRGGLVDVEFISQWAQLHHAAQVPSVLSQRSAVSLQRLGEAGCLPHDIVATLTAALSFWQDVQSLFRAQLGAAGDDADADDLFDGVLAEVTGLPTVGQARRYADTIAADVMAHFDTLIDNPARAIVS